MSKSHKPGVICGNDNGNSAAPPSLPLEAAPTPCVHSFLVLPLHAMHACMPFTSPRWISASGCARPGSYRLRLQ
jgi:hypothetical protein